MDLLTLAAAHKYTDNSIAGVDGILKGEKGDKGDKGDPGPQGPQGDPGAGVGQAIVSGGEIFNDYENNISLGAQSHAEGSESQAGVYGYYIKAIKITDTGGIIYLKSENVVPVWNDETLYQSDISLTEDIINCYFSVQANGYFHWSKIAQIIDIDENNGIVYDGTIALGQSFWEAGEENEGVAPTPFIFYVDNLLTSGAVIIGQSAHAEGTSVLAAADQSHAEGYATNANGRYAHAEGVGTVAGYASHAEGKDTQALGLHSHAEGKWTIANGNQSHAEGESTTASQSNSHAEGCGTISSGYQSHAEGYYTKASNSAAHAEGKETSASANYSHAEGCGTIASGYQSHAEGYYTKASGSATHAEGKETSASANYSHAEGYKTTASGNQSHAEGESTTASQQRAHAEGYKTTASGNQSHAEGESTTASQQNSHAEGCGTIASNFQSHAEGYYTKASGSAAHAEGKETNASAKYSHAEGWGTTASGEYSHAEGAYTIASGSAAHAEGVYTIASGQRSHSAGSSTRAVGTASQANGQYTHATGSLSCAGGTLSGAVGSSAFAFGRGKLALGSASCCIGGPSSVLQSIDASNIELKAESSELTFNADSEIVTNNWGSLAYQKGAICTILDIESNEYYGTVTDITDADNSQKLITVSLFSSIPAGTVISSLNVNSTTIASGAGSAVLGATLSKANGNYSMILGGIYNQTQASFQTMCGYSGNATDVDNLFMVGNGYQTTLSNAFTVKKNGNIVYTEAAQSETGADYAEYFEWEDGNLDNEDRAGYIVALNADKIHFATEEEDVLGVVSGTAAMIGDVADQDWAGKYEIDQFGRTIWEQVEEFIEEEEAYEDVDDNGNSIIKTKTVQTSLGFFPHRKISSNFDPEKTYIPRQQRQEWDTIGIIGKLHIRDDGTCVPGYYVKVGSQPGIATLSIEKTNIRMMKRINDNVILAFVK